MAEPSGPPIAHQSDMPDRSEAEQRDFFAAVMERALRAEERAGSIRHRIDLAGTRVLLCFAGERLAGALMPALRHLEITAAGPAEACFHVWDSAGSGVAMVPPPCPREGFTDRGDIWGFGSARIRSSYHWVECALNLMDLDSGEGVCWFNDAGDLPYWTAASPLRTLFHWLMAARGAHLLHAACVGTEAGGLLITGKGGVGKSTTALACLEAGMDYVADDYLVLQLDPEPRAFSLYCTAKLDAQQMQRFPSLGALLACPDIPAGGKAVLHLHPAHAGRLAKSLPVRLHATPRFLPQAETGFTAIAPVRLQRAAAFTTMAQLPHAGRSTVAFIERLVAEVAGAELGLGHDIAGIAGAVARGLREPRVTATAREAVTRQRLPLVTVVIPVHNGARFLGTSIASILGQDYAALEIIVVDDGSTDAIEAAVQALPVDVRFLRQRHSGPAAARNRGIRDASGEILAFLDVDDIWPAGMLAHLVELLLSALDVMVAKGLGQLVRVGDDGVVHYLGSAAETFPFHISAGVYRRAAFRAIGLFDEDLWFGEDTDWFNRLIERGLRLERLDEVTLLARRHDGNMTRGKSLLEVNALRVFKKALDRRRAPGGEAPARRD
jgi:hypothetical protein